MIRKGMKYWMLLLLGMMAGEMKAGVSALTFAAGGNVRRGDTVKVEPTISTVPEGKAYVCWGVYYDAACTQKVEDVKFRKASKVGANAVWFLAPETEGTYFLHCAVRGTGACEGEIDSYTVRPFAVYPAKADVVLARDAQGMATRVDVGATENLQAYGAMRFSRSVVNDEARSVYERYNYFVSFPFDVQVANIYGIGTVGTHWRILYYDGKTRAEEGYFLAEKTDNWVMIDDTDSVLHAGQGYLLQLNSIQMDEDNEAVWVNDAEYATLYFPALSKISAITTANETIPALGESYACTIAGREAADSYWRCIGVPGFASPSGVEGMPYLYVWDTEDNSLTVESSEDITFEPMQAYLIQNNNAIVWTDVTKPAGVAARQRTTAVQEWKMTLQQGDRECDRTFVRLSDEAGVTDAFDFGFDLSKELNPGRANLYTFTGEERVAANCLPTRERTMVKVGVEIAEEGVYTFSLATGKPINLVDQETGKRTRLGETDYTVSLSPGTYEERFVIEIGETTTDLEESAVSHQPSAYKMLHNGILYIVRDGRIYDAVGKRLF